ncbi:uncharacterized protein TEOVI_000576200 [Trypanosoma equiperdum]|uniref:Uncharacterized protein n=1 Tax=Trypanosoma equiperdum TaxID=5694 RepID=A0A1G4I3Y2_TRYEQ|nr:hypothetical protein, conserved [Trypanosoma equiperdum]
MSSLTSVQRRLLKYALEDKESKKLLKRKRAEDVAPALHQREKKRTCGHVCEADTTQDTEMTPLCPELLDFVRQKCPSAPRKLRKGQLHVINALSRGAVSGKDDDAINRCGARGAFSVKRLEMKDLPFAFSILGLAALQRRLLFDQKVKNGTSLLVLTEDEEDANSVALHLKETYRGVHVLVLDGSRFPSFPNIPNEEDNDGDATNNTFAERTVVLVSSLQAFLSSDGRSAIWKFVGAYVVILRELTNSTCVAMKGMKRMERQEFLKKLCEKRWLCLDHTPVAAVIAPARDALFTPLADALTISVPVAGEDAGEAKTVDKGEVRDSHDENQSKKKKGLPVDTLRDPVTVHYTVVEGQHRFHTLYALVMNARAGQGIVVHVATKEVCQFLYDVLHALGDLPPSLLLLTDYAGPSVHASVRDSDEDRQKVCDKFDDIVVNSDKSLAGSGKRDRVVLISSFGLVPQRGTVFVQYDIIVDIANFSQFVSDVLTPAAYANLAASQLPRLGGRAAPGVTSARRSRSVSPSKSVSPPRPTQVRAMYRHVLLLLRKNELQGALEHFNRSANRLHITYKPMKQMPSATRFLLAVQKLQSLNKKQFAVQNAAYAAYRATMLLYSVISSSKEVYDERNVDLKLVAQEFGYSDAPIVDLRTRDTAFRPKENIFRAACKRAARDRRLLLRPPAEEGSPEVSQPQREENQ